MALLNMDGGSSDPASPQVVPLPQYVAGQRYTGLSALYMNPAWRSPNAAENLLAQARAREAEALRKAQEAAAMAAAAVKPFDMPQFVVDPANPPTPTPVGQMTNPMLNPRTPGPWAPGQAPSEQEAARQAAINTPMSMRVDTMGASRGPERQGYSQEKVWEANRLVGWRYVANGEPTLEDQAQAGAEFTAEALADNYVQEGVTRANVSDVATRRYTTGQMVEADRFGLEGSASPYTWGPYVTEAQTQAYGEIKWVKDVDGRMVPTFPLDPTQTGTMGGQKYIGIDPALQEMGWVHINNPGPAPGPNATLEEQQAYRDAVRQSVTPPRYKVGDQLVVAANMGPAERLEFQKQLRAAGLYEAGDVVHKGVLGAKELQLLHDLMGEANQTGLTTKQVLADYIQRHQDIVAARRAAGGGGGGGGGSTATQTTIQYNPTSIAAGRTLLAGVLEQALGRPPSDTELSQFMAMLNAAENKAPVKTVTNYVRSGSSTTSTSRTTPSSVDPAAMARQFAAEIGGGDEMFAYQSQSYLDKLMQMLVGAQNV